MKMDDEVGTGERRVLLTEGKLEIAQEWSEQRVEHVTCRYDGAILAFRRIFRDAPDWHRSTQFRDPPGKLFRNEECDKLCGLLDQGIRKLRVELRFS